MLCYYYYYTWPAVVMPLTDYRHNDKDHVRFLEFTTHLCRHRFSSKAFMVDSDTVVCSLNTLWIPSASASASLPASMEITNLTVVSVLYSWNNRQTYFVATNASRAMTMVGVKHFCRYSWAEMFQDLLISRNNDKSLIPKNQNNRHRQEATACNTTAAPKHTKFEYLWLKRLLYWQPCENCLFYWFFDISLVWIWNIRNKTSITALFTTALSSKWLVGILL